MAGFPSRISRDALGPQRVNRRPVVNPNSEIGQEHFNLAFYQLAGLNMSSPIAWASIAAAGTVLAHAEAWDPNKETSGPVVTKTATGRYTIAYEASYPDQDGQDVAVGFFGAMVTPQTNGSPALIGNGTVNPASPNEILVRIANYADTAVDYSFMVFIY